MDVHIRPMNHDEGALLDAVFAEALAGEPLPALPLPGPPAAAATRRALLKVDGRDHVAVVAISPQGDAISARIIRDTPRSDDAEVAFEVVDAWQGRGVGRRLLTAIVEAAGRIGLGRVHARGPHRERRRPGAAAVGVPGLPAAP